MCVDGAQGLPLWGSWHGEAVTEEARYTFTISTTLGKSEGTYISSKLALAQRPFGPHLFRPLSGAPSPKGKAFYSTFPPLTVRRNLQPSISAAPRHMSIRPRKMSKYSYMVQIFSSICKFREIFFSSGSTFRLEPVTA